MKYAYLIIPLLVALPLALFQAATISEFHQLPGPIYGGDVYWHYSDALNMYLGAAPWENPQVPGEFAYYGWLLPAAIALIAKLSTLSVMTVYLYLTPAMTLLAAFLIYSLAESVWKNRMYSAVTALAWVSFSPMYATAVGVMAWMVFLPLFLIFLRRVMEEPTAKNKVYAGITQGLVSLAHVVAYPATMLLLALLTVYDGFVKGLSAEVDPQTGRVRFHKAENKGAFTKAVKQYAPTAVIATVIAMLFFAPVIFVYHGTILNPLNEYTRTDFTKYGLANMVETLSGMFFSINSLAGGDYSGFAVSVLTSVGLIAAIIKKEKLLCLITAAGILGGFHYFLTLPLVGKELIPEYFFGSLMKPGSYLLMGYGALFIYEKAKKHRAEVAVTAVFFLLIASMALSVTEASVKDRWVELAKTPAPGFFKFSEWVMENTDKDAVILSGDELSFALNGMTARKVVVSRRTHFSPYLNIFQRTADSAAILYGNDSAKRAELIEKYDIKYFYMNSLWQALLENEPQMVWATPEYSEYLSRYGVAFVEARMPLDPSYGKYARTYGVYVIRPDQPLAKDFVDRLTLVNETVDGDMIYRLYAVKK